MDVFCVLGSGFGVFLPVSSCLPPPLRAGDGLGNPAALLWHRTRFLLVGRVWGGSCVIRHAYIPRSVQSCGLGNRVTRLWHRTVGGSSNFPFRPADPQPLGTGDDMGSAVIGTRLCDFCSLFSVINFASPLIAKVVALPRFSAFSSTHTLPAPPFR